MPAAQSQSQTRRRRRLTDTPLARRHDRLVEARPGKKPSPIPWASFDRSQYPAEALAVAGAAQTALAAGEYGAVIGFAKVAAALALHGAPFDVVALATRIPADEMRHAEYALRMAALLEGRDVGEVALAVDTERLQKNDPSQWELVALDELMVGVPAISETLAAALISSCRDRAADPVVHAMFSSILADEVHHARLGWYYLMWRAPQWTAAERQRIADRIGAQVADTERQFWRGRDTRVVRSGGECPGSTGLARPAGDGKNDDGA